MLVLALASLLGCLLGCVLGFFAVVALARVFDALPDRGTEGIEDMNVHDRDTGW